MLGITSFGGPAMVAYIRRMVVEQKRWLNEASFRDGVALCQTIPGVISMQASAYTGLRVRGVLGALVSFIGFGLPAFSFMMVLSALYARHHSLPAVVSAFSGLRAIIVAIVANAAVSFGRSYLKDWKDAGIAAVAAVMFRMRVSPLLVILSAALLSLILHHRRSSASGQGGAARQAGWPRALVPFLVAVAVGFAVLSVAHRGLFQLATLMFRIDLMAFGGGFASVPLMLHEIVDIRSWMSKGTFMDGIVMGQVTPGPVVITSTFVGYWLYGPVGGLVSTVAVLCPSFLLVLGTVPYFDRLRESAGFNLAIEGVLSSFVGLLVSVTISFGGNVTWDVWRIVLASAAFVALLLRVPIT
jgi:chromate transporter